MRMWMTDPKGMCDKHLLGEHVEMHMFLGAMKRGTSMRGFLDNNLLEPTALLKRHNDLVTEMYARGMKHKSPMTAEDQNDALRTLMPNDRRWIIDHVAARRELHRRCPQCAAGVRR